MKILLDAERCTGCGLCVRVCPQMILAVVDKRMRVRDEARCMGCFGCEDECPTRAVRVSRAPQSVSEVWIESPPGDVRACDVAVVGAGPAGLGAAITCARAGLDVVVLERLTNRTLSHHPDGGVLFTLPWLTSMHVEPDAIAFPELDISLPTGFARTCELLGLLGPDGLSTDNRLPRDTASRAGHKDRFVEALVNEAERAGARIWFNAKVSDVLKEDGRVAGVKLGAGEEVRARVVVAADGAFAQISEKAGMQVSHDDLGYASVLAFEYDNSADLPGGLYYLNGGIEFAAETPGAFGGIGITDVIHVIFALVSRKRTHPAPRPMDYYVRRLIEGDERVQAVLGDSLRGVEPTMLTGCRGVFRARCNEDTVGHGVISVGDPRQQRVMFAMFMVKNFFDLTLHQNGGMGGLPQTIRAASADFWKSLSFDIPKVDISAPTSIMAVGKHDATGTRDETAPL